MLRLMTAKLAIFGALSFFYALSTLAHDVSFLESFKASNHKTPNDIIAEGIVALQNQALSFDEQSQIHKILASQYFFIGEFHQVKIHTDQLKKIGLTNKDNDILIKAYYLESAFYRSQKQYKKAMQSIVDAEKLIKKNTSNYLKNKVYYNAGAALMDNPQGDHALARKYYRKILDHPEPSSEINQRARIRLAKIYIDANTPKEAAALLAPLEKLELKPRIRIHYLQALAQVQAKQGKANPSLKSLDSALKIAKLYNLKTDIERLNNYRKRIDAQIKQQTQPVKSTKTVQPMNPTLTSNTKLP